MKMLEMTSDEAVVHHHHHGKKTFIHQRLLILIEITQYFRPGSMQNSLELFADAKMLPAFGSLQNFKNLLRLAERLSFSKQYC